MEFGGQTLAGETCTMPPPSSPGPASGILCVLLRRMPSLAAIGHQEKEEDEEREEDPGVTQRCPHLSGRRGHGPGRQGQGREDSLDRAVLAK